MAIAYTVVLNGTQTVFSTTFGATDRDKIQLKLASGGVIATGYTIDGIGGSSTNLTVTWPDAINQTLPESLIITKYTDIDAGSPSTSMLTDFSASTILQPTALQNEFAQIYAVFAMIINGADLSTIDLSDTANTVARINSIANLLFNTPTLDGDSNWDGTDTLGDTLEDVITRLTTVEGWDTDDLPNASSVPGATTTAALASLLSSITSLQGTVIGVPDPTSTTSTNNYDALPAEAENDYILGIDENGTYQIQDLRRLVGMIVQEMTKQVQVTGQTQGLVVRKNGTAVDDNQDHGIAFKRSDDTLEHSVFRDEASGAPGLHLVNHIATGGALEFQMRDTGDIAINSKARGAVTFFDESLGDKGAIAPTTVLGTFTNSGALGAASPTYVEIGTVAVTAGTWILRAYAAFELIVANDTCTIGFSTATASAPIASNRSLGYVKSVNAANEDHSCVATVRVAPTGNTTYYLNAISNNTATLANDLVIVAERVL